MHLCWINVRDLQNESKLHHVFLLVLDCDTSWLSQLQSRRANKSVWNLVLISQADIWDGKCTKQMLRRERLSCQMLGKWLGRADKTILTTNSILGSVCCFADWSGIVSFVKAWPSEVLHVLWTGKKSKRLETRGRRGKATRERANGGRWKSRAVCRHSFVITHLWRKRPDILSAMSEAADFYPWSLRCCFFLISKKRNSAVNVLFGDCRLCFLIQEHDSVWISPFQLLCLDLK